MLKSKVQKLNCKEADRLIPYFMEDELDTPDLQDFIEHIKGCPDCEEELSIQFLVSRGLARLEDGNTFDLQKEQNMRMEDASRKLQWRTGMQQLLYLLEALLVLAGIGLLVTIHTLGVM